MNALKTIIAARNICLVILVCIFFDSSTAYGLELIGFGDSITKGTPYVDGRYGNGRRIGGYEPELEKLIRAETSRRTYVYNWGIGGEDTSEGLSRIREVLEKQRNADGILIMEGTNDTHLFSVDTTIHNLESMIEVAKQRKIQPFLATLTPDTRDGRTDKNARIRNEYNPKIRSLAKRTGAMLVDHHKGMNKNWDSYSFDGLHPNRRGYREVAKIWFSGTHSNSPEVRTKLASNVKETDAVLEGLVNPRNSNTEYYFEYGSTQNYGSKTAVMNAGSGNRLIGVSASVSGLSDNSVYHYRLVAINDWGKQVANNISFHTLESSTGAGSCFIVTAAFGSPLASEVDTLKQFRDQYLNQNRIGRNLVQLYYQVSPPLANWISRHPFWKTVTQSLLYPLVVISSIAVENQVPGAIIAIPPVVFLLLTVLLIRKYLKKKCDVQHTQ